ncbi:hypothetical protein Tco_1301931 [Tanacetum coccineum]
MLATGRYAQWRSRFLRYIDTKTNGDALRKCILEGPYIPSTVVIQVMLVTENSPAVPEHTTVKTILNMSPANKAHFESEKEAIHMILTGIGDEIYSTVDACNTAHEMLEAIERLQQDNATYSASAEEIAVQFCFFDIQLTKCLSPRKLFLQKCFSEYQGIRQSASENAGCLKPDPLDSRALGACFIHTKLSIEGRLFLDDLDQRTLPAEQLKPPPFF